LWQLFQRLKYVCIDFDKNGLGYILGDFFTNLSGHPSSHLVTLALIWSPWLSSGHPGSHLVTLALIWSPWLTPIFEVFKYRFIFKAKHVSEHLPLLWKNLFVGELRQSSLLSKLTRIQARTLISLTYP
jgi:hypothetical protein